MILNGMKCIQSRDSFVYHLTCRGGQFQDGIEQITKDQQFHSMKHTAARNYLRKWGSWIKNDSYQHPIISPKYNIAIVLTNGNIHALETLEPWCDRIYVENKFDYIQKEQPNTKFDLSKRVMTIGLNDPQSENDIVIEIDANKFNQRSFELLQQLPLIIKESGDIGTFELEDLKITINQMEEKQNDLIKLV
jgi:hypothetical protein